MLCNEAPFSSGPVTGCCRWLADGDSDRLGPAPTQSSVRRQWAAPMEWADANRCEITEAEVDRARDLTALFQYDSVRGAIAELNSGMHWPHRTGDVFSRKKWYRLAAIPRSCLPAGGSSGGGGGGGGGAILGEGESGIFRIPQATNRDRDFTAAYAVKSVSKAVEMLNGPNAVGWPYATAEVYSDTQKQYFRLWPANAPKAPPGPVRTPSGQALYTAFEKAEAEELGANHSPAAAPPQGGWLWTVDHSKPVEQAVSEACDLTKYTRVNCVLAAADQLNSNKLRWPHPTADVYDLESNSWYRLVSSLQLDLPRFLWSKQGNVLIEESEVDADRNLTVKHQIDSVTQVRAAFSRFRILSLTCATT